MLRNLLKYKFRVFAVVILVLALVLVRAYEDLFYDPFLNYFKSDYSVTPIPTADNFLLFANLLIRYVLNSVLSLAIIYVIFRDRGMVSFASFLYLIFFIALIACFFFFL